MSEQDLMRLREMLLQRRREIFERLRRLEADWQALGERDIELEEEAQKSDLTILYDQLDELETEEIEEIDLALYKIAGGKFGACEGCGKPISLNRLEALPATRLCRKCAHKYEAKQKKLPRAREIITPAEPPTEYRNLNDGEMQTAILERLKSDGRIDLDELEVSCQKGVVSLEGFIPSESEHQILMRILMDMMGFSAIIDHLHINELVWERKDRAPGRTEFPPSPDLDDISEDVFESGEEDRPYMFPDRPPPEKE